MHRTDLGTTRLLARPGERRLWLLNAASAALWDLHAAGWDTASLAGLLAERFGMVPDAARAQVLNHQAQWRRVGLLDAATLPDLRLGVPDDPVWPAPRPRPLPPGAARLAVADRHIGLAVTAADLQTTLRDWLAPATGAGAGEVDHMLRLTGTADSWHLYLDGSRREAGASDDGALVATLAALTELGCRPAERLLVIHGAGLVQPDGRGLLLVAPGGSGKSTLAAALDAVGCGLLSDDVVPVTLDGDLLGLGLPLCLKAGSWPVLAAQRPDLAQAPTLQRFGQPVRYLPARSPAPAGPVPPAHVLLSRYRPGCAPALRPVAPEDLLAGLLAAEAVIRDLTQTKLAALARWVQTVPAWQLTYPDLDRALALIADLTEAGSRP